jgi:hypothetical protein
MKRTIGGLEVAVGERVSVGRGVSVGRSVYSGVGFSGVPSEELHATSITERTNIVRIVRVKWFIIGKTLMI